MFLSMETAPLSVKSKLLSAALKLVRTQGFEATTVDALCREAGVTKGAFFHYFASKEAISVAAAEYWNAWLDDLFASAPYNKLEDPLDRLLGYIDFRIHLINGANLAERTCLLGTLVQEIFITYPAIREACREGIALHARKVQSLVEQAKGVRAPHATWTAESVAMHTQAVIQGAFILAKAENKPDLAIDSLRHLRHYIELLFRYEKAD
jgi:TetR/AcrR family transcriptional regulator, transcriptional repressor for nem operon